MKYTKGQLSSMAKKISKTNTILLDAIGMCEDLSHDNDIRNILNGKDEYSDEYILLVERIKKYTNDLMSADARLYGLALEDATDLLQIAYEDINA